MDRPYKQYVPKTECNISKNPNIIWYFINRKKEHRLFLHLWFSIMIFYNGCLLGFFKFLHVLKKHFHTDDAFSIITLLPDVYNVVSEPFHTKGTKKAYHKQRKKSLMMYLFKSRSNEWSVVTLQCCEDKKAISLLMFVFQAPCLPMSTCNAQ